MEFWPRKETHNTSIEINDEKIPLVQVMKFLGVYLDNKLKWEYHTNQVYNKVQTNKQMLQHSRNFLDTKTLIKMYYAHIYSHMRYGLVVWGSMLSKHARNELEKIQMACVRIAGRQKKNSPVNDLLSQLDLLKFSDLIDLELLKFGYQLSRKNLPDPINKIMNQKGGKKTHRYPTCNKHIPNVQKHNDKHFNKGYLCKGVTLFTNASTRIKDAPSLKAMIKEVKCMNIRCYAGE